MPCKDSAHSASRPGQGYCQVLSGLSLGDQIVRGPFDSLRKLKSGQKVKLKKKDSSDSEESQG